MGTDSTFVANAQASQTTLSRSKTFERPASADWNIIRAEEWHPLADAATGDGMRLGHELLASSS
jgi:hypothetical protein